MILIIVLRSSAKMKTKLLFTVLTTVLFHQSTPQCFPPYAGQQPSKNTHSDLYGGQQDFSLALLNAINKIMPKENLFFSPYSTYHALLIAYFMAGGQTESYLKKVLRLQENEGKSDVYAAYKIDKFMTQFIAKNAPYEFTSANKIYVSDEVPVRECVANDFPQELEKFAFKKDPEGSRVAINNWVENTTHHMITDLLPPGTIDSSTDLVLVNAAYFKGIWENKFNPELTKQEIFYVNPSKQIMVDMMHVEGTFRHDISEALGAHILELPYKGENISMFILLPPFSNTEDSIDATLKSLSLENFRKIVDKDSLISRTVQVALPKFSLETTIELVPALEHMGIGNLFQSSANLTALTDGKLHLGNALHKARIEVNEEGTKAAAATVLFSFRSSRPAEPAQFICNHPFIYLIYDQVQNAILFGGLFRRPY
ncbi:serine protease inhibitor 88Ea-like isoform X2 [Cylas formicarius]|uniref:serine protease inhibitor 88Ea-like isoform X2 n=1 Tax=Cylas formicarius TaxID=197179 RepID=UPI00295892EE|nr:serine protease inhibitor 88Ea-like isoform X2 [Cylas formicarius]